MDKLESKRFGNLRTRNATDTKNKKSFIVICYVMEIRLNKIWGYIGDRGGWAEEKDINEVQ